MVRKESDSVPREPASWGEALNEYAKQKTTRPRPDSEYVRPEYVTRYQKSREEVEDHPILQTFRDAPRESAAKVNEDTQRIVNINKARDRQIATESRFDILTFADKRAALPQPPAPGATDMLAPFNSLAERPTFRHPLDSCYQYNIVSNLPLSEHHYTAPAMRPKVKEELPNSGKPRLQHMAALPRDFNILSNRYIEQHDTKVQLEREIQRRTAAQKYWETHDYEPLLGHYVMPEKEARFQEAMASELAKQPLKSFNRLPPSLQKGEGFVYDITTHQVKSEDLYAKEQRREEARIERQAHTWNRQEKMRNDGLERSALADTRAVNRQAHQRYIETFQHGYNIVDHRDFTDPATYLPPPRTRPKPTLWQAAGPNRPPPPPPVPEPAPAIAPLLSTIPQDGPWASSTAGTIAREALRASSRSMGELASSMASLGNSSCMSATSSSKVGGLAKLAQYEANAPAYTDAAAAAPM